ncbi:DUF2637 domain-containing protein [Streptomyces prunicolor]|nr:DUF2637 domain-containing protein [Streptomyces prunicolor]
MAGVAASASYVHHREFALQGGADPVSASLWALSVDGLLLVAMAGLLRSMAPRTRRARCGRLSCWGSRCRWRRMWRRLLRWSGSPCWWRGGRQSVA